MRKNGSDMATDEDLLEDVRALPLAEIIAADAPDLDDALQHVLHGLSTTTESLAAFGAAP